MFQYRINIHMPFIFLSCFFFFDFFLVSFSLTSEFFQSVYFSIVRFDFSLFHPSFCFIFSFLFVIIFIFYLLGYLFISFGIIVGGDVLGLFVYPRLPNCLFQSSYIAKSFSETLARTYKYLTKQNK